MAPRLAYVSHHVQAARAIWRQANILHIAAAAIMPAIIEAAASAKQVYHLRLAGICRFARACRLSVRKAVTVALQRL